MLYPSEVSAIVDQVAQGHRDAFRPIVRAYSLPLRSFLASQVHHLEDVADLAQEVFVAAYRGLGTFRKGDDLGAWLRGIARNKLSEYFRGSSRRHKALERFRAEVLRAVRDDLERATADDHEVQIEALLRCVGRLPEKLRRVVRGGLDGDKPSALAEEFLTSVGAVYNLHYRAVNLLRDCLHKELA